MSVPEPDVEAVVCIPTFRRPEGLARALASLATQSTRRRFAIVVAENDAGAAGAAVAKAFLAAHAIPGRVVAESDQGNCSAINAAFSAALDAFPAARHCLMIDDDEWAEPDWLERMVAAAEASGAAIVGGPVLPRLPASAPAGLSRHPAFAPAFHATGPVPLIYGSGNCLITRAAFARMGRPFFDPRFNFLGGGDTDFFVRARAAGLAFHWVAEARVGEVVPPERLRPGWLAARGLRVGAINHRVEPRRPGLAGRARLALKTLALLAAAGPRGLRLLAETREPLIALHPFLVALGRLLAAFGVEPQPYRAPPLTRTAR